MSASPAPSFRCAILFLLALLAGCSKSDFERFKEEAEKGDSDAQVFVGNCYANGQGVEADIGQAMSWYHKAAMQGHAQAQCDIGVRYLYGMGVRKDEIEAYAYFALAGPANEQARKNLAFLQKQLSGGDLLLGLKRKKELQAEMVASRAEKAVVSRPAERRGGQLSQSDSVSTEEKLRKDSEDDRVKVQGYRMKAEAGDARAQYFLGYSYFNGRGVAMDVDESFKWYRKAAEQGDAGAQLALGGCYYAGKGVAKDDVEAYAYWSLAEHNYPAMYAGLLDRVGQTVSPDARILGMKRAKELQKEIQAKIAAKKAGK
jgi:TPR repeat protein